MCGIVGYIGKEPAVSYLLEGLHILQNRGYDSAGVATIHKDANNTSIVSTKYASLDKTNDSIILLDEKAPERHGKDSVGIAHTRWATHGGKTDANAHPHLDYKDRIALVHNGTIENSSDLRTELESHGIVFRSQTDTEVIVQLIGHYMDNGFPVLLDAIKKSIPRLEGTWGIVVISKEQPDQMIAARNGSPLVVGIGKDNMFVASEFTAFCRHTSQYISLNDHEVIVLKANSHDLDLSRVEEAPEEKMELSPAPHPHWTIKEIIEQPQAINRSLAYGSRIDKFGIVRLGGLDANVNLLKNIKNLVIAACGTSHFASLYGAQLMRHLNSFDTVQPIDAAEFTTDFIPRHDPGMLVVTQSGETKDVMRALQLSQSSGLPAFSVVNAVGSLIARTTKCGVYLNAGREHAVASTKAFTTQVTALALIAAWFSQIRDSNVASASKRAELISSLHDLATYTAISLNTRAQMKTIADLMFKNNTQHLFVLGKGYSESIAREGALKIKEITYVHAEGVAGGSLKHGPFALIEDNTPVILFILDDQHASLMNIAAQEVRARGAYTIVITDNDRIVDKKAANEIVRIPSNGPLTALLGIIPLQMLAYELAVAKGIQPDMPRNLAKTVTVD